MLESIQGVLKKKQPTYAIVDVHGVSFRIHISLPTFEFLPKAGTRVTILVYLHVREDILDLFGFHSENQRDLFRMLIGISGIGPKLAMTILAGTSPSDFKARIIVGDVKSLTVIPGIGPKTAKRMIVELKEKFVISDDDESLAGILGDSTQSDLISDAINAMVSLGYSRGQAHQALKRMETSGGVPGSLEDILKKALSIMM